MRRVREKRGAERERGREREREREIEREREREACERIYVGSKLTAVVTQPLDYLWCRTQAYLLHIVCVAVSAL